VRCANLDWRRIAVTSAVLTAIVGCATTPSDEAVRAQATEVMKASFKPRGQAHLDRLDQDETQKVCSAYAGHALPGDVAKRIEQDNLKTLGYPADDKLLGDWKNGEKVAQEGRGKQYSDDPAAPTGGNCYACHRLSAQELSYGTIGPSLYRFGKDRGYTDESRRYAYGKVYNADAFVACSNMPRFGYKGILTEQQIKDVVALLMDPASPVNQ